jgi:3-hydroxy acid dehydrogenase / malonic semialdehyde reductase
MSARLGKLENAPARNAAAVAAERYAGDAASIEELAMPNGSGLRPWSKVPALALPGSPAVPYAQGMVVLVTGASSGFGAAICRRFAREGHRLIGIARRPDKLTALRGELGDALAATVTLDVRDSDAVARAIGQLPPELSDIDVLVNNAGLARGLEPAQRASLADWNEMIDTNVKGLVAMTHAVLPGMVGRDRGHVVNIGSTAATWPYPGSNVYGATKAFVHQFSLNLRADLFGTHVRVSVVDPGMVGGTEFSNVRFYGDDGRAARVYEGTEPLLADDVAETVHWLTTLPARVNVNSIELMPVGQSFAGLAVWRGPGT